MAQFGKLPEVVKFIEFGKEHLAFPVASRDFEHHLGENGEPLLNLFYVKPLASAECLRCHFTEQYHGKPYAPQAPHQPCDKFQAPPISFTVDPKQFVQIAVDVPHISHKFNDEQLEALKNLGNSVEINYPGKQIPGGRWRELTSAELERAAAAAHEREIGIHLKTLSVQREAEQKKALEAPAPAPQQALDEVEKEARVRHRLEQLRASHSQPGVAEPEKPKAPEGGGGDGGDTGSGKPN